MEEWKVIEGFSRYKISNIGKVWDTKRDVEVAQQLTGIPKYIYVNVVSDEGVRKLKRVHRFVAEAFVKDRTEEFNIVDHIDRDKFNNHFENLRWVDNSGNQRNVDSNIYVGDVFIKDYVLKYENPDHAYAYLCRVARGSNIEAAVKQYEEYLIYGFKNIKVKYEDEEHYLTDLCKEYNKSYELVLSRISQDWPVWNALFGVPYKYTHSFEVKGQLVNYWYPSKGYFQQKHNRSVGVLNELLDQSFTLQEILEYTGQVTPIYDIDGVIASMEEHCKSRGLSVSAVSTRMTKNGASLEEALRTPRGKVKVIKINGIAKSPKKWSEEFGLNPKSVIATRGRKGFSFKEVFEYFGVDISNMIFEEV